MLAQILGETRNKVVVTTNFDNLVVDALSIYTTATPLICGHESLAGFIRTKPSRPQVVKVHRDLFYAPKNANDELGELPPPFADALKSLFATHVPIVIGYGGNDGSLMRVFEEMPSGMLSQLPTPMRTSRIAACTPGTITVLKLRRRLSIVRSMLAELSTRKNTSASRMRVSKVNSRVSRGPRDAGA